MKTIRKFGFRFYFRYELKLRKLQMSISSLSRERFPGFNLVKNSK